MRKQLAVLVDDDVFELLKPVRNKTALVNQLLREHFARPAQLPLEQRVKNLEEYFASKGVYLQ